MIGLLLGFVKTWIKRILYLSSAFFFLYFFGDFRINDVNVRDFLQSVVPPRELWQGKEKILEVARTGFRFASAQITTMAAEGKEDDKAAGAEGSAELDPLQILDKIGPQDQQKMIDLLKEKLNTAVPKNLTETISGEAPPPTAAEINKAIDQITKDTL